MTVGVPSGVRTKAPAVAASARRWRPVGAAAVRVGLASALACAAGGCGRASREPPARHDGGPGAGAAVAARPPDAEASPRRDAGMPLLVVRLDGDKLARLTAADLAAGPTLAAVLGDRAPARAWHEVDGRAAAGAFRFATGDELRRVAAATLTERDGVVTMTPPQAAGAAAPLVGVQELEVWTRPPPSSDAPGALELHAGERRCRLGAAELEPVPALALRAGHRGDQEARSAWTLAALAVACFGPGTTVTEASAGALRLRLDDVRAAGHEVIVKRNRRGLFKLRVVDAAGELVDDARQAELDAPVALTLAP